MVKQFRVQRVLSARRILNRKRSVLDWCQGRYDDLPAHREPVCLRRNRYDDILKAWLPIDECLATTQQSRACEYLGPRVIRDGVQFARVRLPELPRVTA